MSSWGVFSSRVVQPLLVLFYFYSCVAADGFIKPFENEDDLGLALYLGDRVTVTWTASVLRVKLYVTYWIDNPPPIGVLLNDGANTGSYQWTIGENDGIDSAVIARNTNFALRLRDSSTNENRTGRGFVDGILSSPGFRILDRSTQASTPSYFSRLSLGGKVGIILGPVLGGLALISFAWFLYQYRKQRRGDKVFRPSGDFVYQEDYSEIERRGLISYLHR